jgi:hypothetical protein
MSFDLWSTLGISREAGLAAAAGALAIAVLWALRTARRDSREAAGLRLNDHD